MLEEQDVKLVPGYYEWHLLWKNNLFYVLGDEITEFIQEDKVEESIEYYCSLVIEEMKEDIEDNFENNYCDLSDRAKEILYNLSEEDFKVIEKVLFDTFTAYYN